MKNRRAASSSAGVIIVIIVIIIGLYTGLFTNLLSGLGGSTSSGHNPITVSGSVDGGTLNSPFQVTFTNQATGQVINTAVNGIVGIGDSYSVTLYTFNTYLVQIIYDNVLEQQGSCNAGYMYLYMDSAAFTADISCGGGPYGTKPETTTMISTSTTYPTATFTSATCSNNCVTTTAPPPTSTVTTLCPPAGCYTTQTTSSGNCPSQGCAIEFLVEECQESGNGGCIPVSDALILVFYANCLSYSCYGLPYNIQGQANANGAITVNVPYSLSTDTVCYYGSYSTPAIACATFIPSVSQSVILEYYSTGFVTNRR